MIDRPHCDALPVLAADVRDLCIGDDKRDAFDKLWISDLVQVGQVTIPQQEVTTVGE
ncbi:MAG: hypothetical protein VXW65_08455 [Pseudomonadota bacterium]|nr:hypothetical protein [Pseudomonadota bacterium]